MEHLIRRMVPLVRRRVWHALARRAARISPADGEDLVQEVWLGLLDGALRRFLAFDPVAGGSLESYVGMIANREFRKLLLTGARSKQGESLTVAGASDPIGSAPTPEETVATGELAVRLDEHLEEVLPARGRLVLQYSFLDELAPEEVAQRLGVSVQIVYDWQHRIRAAARAFIASS